MPSDDLSIEYQGETVALGTAQQLSASLVARQIPMITSWNRLEGRPRSDNFDRAMKAEVRDPLWMLCKQWQMGEFIGEDAGSPTQAAILLEQQALQQSRAGDHPAKAFSDAIPLEAQVERQALPLLTTTGPASLDLRLAIGRRFAKLLTRAGLAAHVDKFLLQYPIERPAADDEDLAGIVAHPESSQRFAMAAGKVIDGVALYLYLRGDSSRRPDDGIGGISAGDSATIQQLGLSLLEWIAKTFQQPAPDEDAWQPQRLEYKMAVSTRALTETSGNDLVASEYYHGRLDWYHFDRQPVGQGDRPATPTDKATSFIPSPITFDGMPHPRWWQFEDSKTNFAAVDPATTDLGKLLFLEYMLLYANDWYLFPYRVDSGSTAIVRGLSVTNVFGERFWIEAAGSGNDDSWQRWGLFSNNSLDDPNDTSDRHIAILPTVPKIQDSQQAERVMLIRDEMANQVWGIETQVRLPHGKTQRGAELAAETRNFYRQQLGEVSAVEEIPTDASLRYQIMNRVPENWIPFIPVHKEGDNRQTKLQRAAMPRVLEGDPNPPQRVRPRTTLLRHGLDGESIQPYFIEEEEVPRAGVVVNDGFRRTRWYGGKTLLWRGLQKHTGRGEGSSGLAFDQLLPKAPQQPVTDVPVPPPGHAFIDYEGETPPQISIDVQADAVSGWNIRTQLQHFELAPERVSTTHQSGEGHLHLYVNGIKLTRVYSEWFHLPDLLPGDHEVELGVSANDHSPIRVDGKVIRATQTINQESATPPAPASGEQDVPPASAPIVALMVHEDPAQGYNLEINLSSFVIAPQNVSDSHVSGEGYVQLFIDGVKVARLYSPWYYVPPLAAGDHTITVGLFTNDHRPYASDGTKLEASVDITVAGGTRHMRGSGHH